LSIFSYNLDRYRLAINQKLTSSEELNLNGANARSKTMDAQKHLSAYSANNVYFVTLTVKILG